MEDEMISLCNIMPVELAIKREMEYRKKMEALNSRNQNELAPLMLAQDLPIQARKEDNQLAPSRSQIPPMIQFSSSCQTFQEQVLFSCKACRLTFATVFQLSSHIVGEQHKLIISQMKKRREAISNPIWCELCKSSCSSLGEMERHLKGSRHNPFVMDLASKSKRKKH
uniref:zinc finger RNA-binding protein-like isoform X2 n=1 Tax=Erigeron canadensis TaxID=72917 RepID=UPI001CB9D012|nr:zinc finger RNA-binding protein-like isoform X2 [Erigeron canadensis]